MIISIQLHLVMERYISNAGLLLATDPHTDILHSFVSQVTKSLINFQSKAIKLCSINFQSNLNRSCQIEYHLYPHHLDLQQCQHL